MKNITRVLAVIMVIVIFVLAFAGCSFKGYDWVDTNYHFNRAIIKMPDGSVEEIEIAKWADAEDGEQLTITAKDGKRYLVNSVNCILIEDSEGTKND